MGYCLPAGPAPELGRATTELVGDGNCGFVRQLQLEADIAPRSSEQQEHKSLEFRSL
jgi:hypothetical protein